MRFGAHMSIAGGLHNALLLGERAGCESIQLFTRNQQQWQAKPLGEDEIALFRAEQQRTGLGPLVVHASYLINLASPDDALWQRSIGAFGAELERCHLLGIPYVVIHPGAHMGTGVEAGIARVAAALDSLFAQQIGGTTMVLLETTAGHGSFLGGRFEQLAAMRALSRFPERLGVCVDTCHIFAAGYDIRSRAAYATTMAELDATVGIPQVRAFHLNDSVMPLGSHRDRHAHIGEGEIGLAGFRNLVNDRRFAGLPMLLETPKGKDLAEDLANMARLRGLIRSSRPRAAKPAENDPASS